jgi:hypothetical protein
MPILTVGFEKKTLLFVPDEISYSRESIFSARWNSTPIRNMVLPGRLIPNWETTTGSRLCSVHRDDLNLAS